MARDTRRRPVTGPRGQSETQRVPARDVQERLAEAAELKRGLAPNLSGSGSSPGKVVTQKEGRRISTKMRAKLEQAIVHAQNSIATIREVLADDAAEQAAGDDEAKTARLLRDWSRADRFY